MINIIILFVLLLFLSMFIYLTNGRKIISAGFLGTAAFAFAAFSYIVAYNNFNKDISGKTVTVIILAMVALYLGDYFGSRMYLKKRNKITQSTYLDLDIPHIYTYMISLYNFAVALIRFWDLYQFSRSIGNKKGVLYVFISVRAYFTAGEYSISTIVSILSGFAEASAYTYSYFLLYNMIIKKKFKKIYLLPILTYCLIQVTTTGRTGFIKLFMMMVIISMILIERMPITKHQQNRKVIKFAVGGLLLALIFFLGYGYFIRRSDRTLISYLAGYVGAGIYGLDHFLEYGWGKNEMFGKWTLQNYYYYLNKFGANFPIPQQHLEFFSYGEQRSNIYSGLAFPIQDFGIIGMLVTRFIIGLIYGKLISIAQKYKRIDKSKSITFIIIVAYMYYAVLIYPIADRFIEMLTVITFPLMCITIAFFNNMLISKKKITIK